MTAFIVEQTVPLQLVRIKFALTTHSCGSFRDSMTW